jgi:hypothetical protein
MAKGAKELKGWRQAFVGRDQDLLWLERVRLHRSALLAHSYSSVNEGAPKEFSGHWLRIIDAQLASPLELYCAWRMYGAAQARAGWAREGKVMGLGVFFGTGQTAKRPWEGWVDKARVALPRLAPILVSEFGPLAELPEVAPGATEGGVGGAVMAPACPPAPPAPVLGHGAAIAGPPTPPSGTPALSGLEGPLPGLEGITPKKT